MAQNESDNWNQGDAIALRNFIAQNPKFLRLLFERHRPKVEGETVEARAMSGSDLNGFLVCMDAIKAMQQDPTAGGENPGFIDNSQNAE